jgi:hypothetical protein
LPLVTTDQIATFGNVHDTPMPGNGKFRRGVMVTGGGPT